MIQLHKYPSKPQRECSQDSQQPDHDKDDHITLSHAGNMCLHADTELTATSGYCPRSRVFLPRCSRGNGLRRVPLQVEAPRNAEAGPLHMRWEIVRCPCSKIYPWGKGSPMKHVADDFASVQ
jgi:hypothetical protein